jgi:hypothetical protein
MFFIKKLIKKALLVEKTSQDGEMLVRPTLMSLVSTGAV